METESSDEGKDTAEITVALITVPFRKNEPDLSYKDWKDDMQKMTDDFIESMLALFD